MDRLIHVLCLETHNEGISLISFLCSKPLALPVQEHALPLLCSAVKPRDGHFSTEEKTVILNVCKFNSSFKGIFWEKERLICSFRGFCNKQWENKTLQSFEDKEHYTTRHDINVGVSIISHITIQRALDHFHANQLRGFGTSR